MVLLNASVSVGIGGGVGGSSLDLSIGSSSPPSAALSFISSASGQGLPSSQIPSQLPAIAIRNIMHWFVPEVGVIDMFINPQSVKYGLKKLIQRQRTKGGYVVQYWGEELTTLNINGNTGSSGVEGLNVLEEVYRSEQLTFDPIAMMGGSQSSVAGISDLISGAVANIGGIGSTLAAVSGGILSTDPLSNAISPTTIPSLASLALGIELYWAGWVFRGYFESFSFDESAEKIGMFDYQMQFVVTQRRGYRTNAMPWQHSAINGPSNWGLGGPPLTFAGLEEAPPVPGPTELDITIGI
jgi:hypothetical protein